MIKNWKSQKKKKKELEKPHENRGHSCFVYSATTQFVHCFYVAEHKIYTSQFHHKSRQLTMQVKHILDGVYIVANSSV